MKRSGDLLTRHKTPVTIQDAVIYKQVTIRTNYKGVVLRGTKMGVEIGTKNQWRVSAGQFILSRIDARNGAFGIIPKELEGAIVTNDFLAFDVNEDEVEREFFNVFLQSPVFLDACIKASRGNTNRKRIEEDFFLAFELNLPPLSQQRRLITKINKARLSLAIANREIIHQEILLTKLRQAILQEAVQGNLTANWRAANPDAEPASQLLHRIQTEKAHLITEKKISKEKPLPEIIPEEVPFEIPKEWRWSQIAEIGVLSPRNEAADDTLTSFVPMPMIAADYGVASKHEVRRWGDIKKGYTHFAEGDVGLAKITPCFQNGKSTVFRNMTGGLGSGTTELHIVRPLFVNPNFILLFLKCPYFIETGIPKMTGTAGQKRVPVEYFAHSPFPLPSLAEQAVIVERVEALMTTCQALEAEVERSRSHAAHLLQAVLKEAFNPKGPDKNHPGRIKQTSPEKP